jgi:hypothetical protein
MRALFIGALCTALVGCSSPMPSRGNKERGPPQSFFSRTAATAATESKRTAFRPKVTKKLGKPKKMTGPSKKRVAIPTKPTAAKPAIEGEPVEDKAKSGVMEPGLPPSAQPSPTPDRVLDQDKQTTAVGGKPENPESAQPSEPSDPVLEKAKVKIAAKMENPASSEFVDIRRVTRKNTFGSSSEIVCGRVKGKKKSGETIVERPFLYLVKEDEAYIVDRGPESMAAIMYRAQCTSAH